MIRIDLGRLLPIGVLAHLLALIPGFFFLVCIALGNSYPAAQLAAQLQFVVPFGPFGTLFIAVFLAFVLGTAFVLLVSLIQYLLIRAHLIWRDRAHLLLPVLDRLVLLPLPKDKPRWLLNWRNRNVNKVNISNFPIVSETRRSAFLWWRALAKHLLRTRYGMKEEQFPDSNWQPMREVLTAPTSQELYGDPMIFTAHTTGWSALAATFFAPDLRTWWFYVFAWFLVGFGLLQLIYVTRASTNPEIGDTLRIRAILREFPKLKPRRAPKIEPEEEPDEE